jgi:hypothetical protein
LDEVDRVRSLALNKNGLTFFKVGGAEARTDLRQNPVRMNFPLRSLHASPLKCGSTQPCHGSGLAVYRINPSSCISFHCSQRPSLFFFDLSSLTCLPRHIDPSRNEAHNWLLKLLTDEEAEEAAVRTALNFSPRCFAMTEKPEQEFERDDAI